MNGPKQEQNKKALAKYWAIARKNYNPYQIAALKAQEEFFLDTFWPVEYLTRFPKDEKFYTDLLTNHLKERSELPNFAKTKDAKSATKYITEIHDDMIKIDKSVTNWREEGHVEFDLKCKKGELKCLEKQLAKLEAKVR